jgi:hypothetical protein
MEERWRREVTDGGKGRREVTDGGKGERVNIWRNGDEEVTDVYRERF